MANKDILQGQSSVLQQSVANILIAWADYTLVALGFGVVYSICRFFHFSHGAFYTLGAYAVLLCVSWLRLPVWIACVLALAICALAGCAVEYCVYSPVRRRNASSLTLMLTSLGLYVVLVNCVSLTFGDESRRLWLGAAQSPLTILGARATPLQIITVVVAAIALMGVVLFLRATRAGKAVRAVASNSDLAEVSGVASGRARLVAFAIGSGLAALAGLAAALDVDMSPTMGMTPLVVAVVVVVIAGTRSVLGIALVAALLAAARHAAAMTLGTQWEDATAFAILLLFLLLRPQGSGSRVAVSARV